MVIEGSGACDAIGAAAGAVPTDLNTVAPGCGADAVGTTEPATGVTVIDGDVLNTSATQDHPIDEPLSGPSSMVVNGSGASDQTGTAPASMVVEGSTDSDAVGITDPTNGVTAIEGDMLIGPRTARLQDPITHLPGPDRPHRRVGLRRWKTTPRAGHKRV